MKQMKTNAMIRPTSEAKGYLDHLKKQSVFSRAVDAYAFAAAFAMNQGMDISAVSLTGRSDLTEVDTLDDKVRLALEAAAAVLARRNGVELADSASVVDLVTKYAEVGLPALKERWSGKSGLQIQNDIQKILSDSAQL
ncbi:MAG TPA: hypothetical protein VGB73_04455 [Pyrinomonadaceae bacterium]|jgi:hypothetical protein